MHLVKEFNWRPTAFELSAFDKSGLEFSGGL
jgi:hypothetical protein